MPSSIAKQHRFMESAAHNPDFAKKAGIPVSTAQEFVAADKRTKKYAEGGEIEGHGLPIRPVNENPSEAQKEAGNYLKAPVYVHGMRITIENPAGTERRGVGHDGAEWRQRMVHDYGYIRGTVGRDKDHLDVLLGPHAHRSDVPVHVVDQVHPETGDFDEHKVVLGAKDADHAAEIYHANYEPGWRGFGAVTPMSLREFKDWAFDKAKKTKPTSELKKFANGGSVAAAWDAPEPVESKEGAAFGVYPGMGKRGRNERAASADMPLHVARGAAAGLLGTPGDLELAMRRAMLSDDEDTFMPTSQAMLERIPFRGAESPARRAAESLGISAAGMGLRGGALSRVSKFADGGAVERMSEEDLAAAPHAQLYMAREGATPEEQNRLSPYEHRAFAREAVSEHPFMALPLSAAIPLYQAYKAAMGARSRPSLEQVKQGYVGVGEGLKRAAGYAEGGSVPEDYSAKSITGALQDPQFYKDMLRNLTALGNRNVAYIVGGPTDIADLALRGANAVTGSHMKLSDKPVGSSPWLMEQMQKRGFPTTTGSGGADEYGDVAAGALSMAPAQAARVVGKAIAAPSREGLRLVESGMRGEGPLSQVVAPVAPMFAVKPKGGNWSTSPQVGGPTPDNWEQVIEHLGLGGDNTAPAVRQWRDKQLRNYMRNQMGTADDPLLKLEAEGRLHMAPEDLIERSGNFGVAPVRVRGADNFMLRSASSDPGSAFHKQTTGRDYRTPWENLSDAAVGWRSPKEELADLKEFSTFMGAADSPHGMTLDQLIALSPDNAHLKGAEWLEKAPADTKLYHLLDTTGELGFNHVLDYLNAATRAGAHAEEFNRTGMVPREAEELIRRGLHLDPEKLGSVSVADAVAKTHEWNKLLSEGKRLEDMNKGVKSVLKAYPDTGHQWVELSPEGLQSEGNAMRHCVGGYCSSVESGNTRILSLRDKEGSPKVTVELRPGRPLTANPLPSSMYRQGTQWEGIVTPQMQEEYENYFKASGAHSMHFADNYWPWLKEAHPDVYAKAAAPGPASIIQIKGPANRAPSADVLPHVQDLVRGGIPGLEKWGGVSDLRNARLRAITDVFNPLEQATLRQRGHQLPEHITDQEVEQLQKIFGGHNYAQGGSVLTGPAQLGMGPANLGLESLSFEGSSAPMAATSGYGAQMNPGTNIMANRPDAGANLREAGKNLAVTSYLNDVVPYGTGSAIYGLMKGKNIGDVTKEYARAGVKSAVLGPLAPFAGAAEAAQRGRWGQAVGSALGYYFGGNLGSGIGSAVGSWVDDSGVGKGIADTWHGIADSAGDVVSGLGHALGFAEGGVVSGTDQQALAQFRNEFMRGNPALSTLQDEYDAKIPAALGQIAKRTDAEDVFQRLHREYIYPATVAAKDADYYKTLDLHQRMVEDLRSMLHKRPERFAVTEE